MKHDLGVHRCTHFNVEDYLQGQVTRGYIELVADGLASDTLVPILVARGRKPGPVFGITAAVHGNELNGIRVIHDIMANVNVSSLRGTLVAVVCVNVPGLHSHEREIYGQFDLNHMFPGNPLGNTAEVYANRVLDRIVGKFDYLVDLHTASFGRVNSLYVRADLSDETSRNMALRQRPQIILHNMASDRTLRGAAMERGIPSITVEVGDPQRFQSRYIKATRNGLWTLLADAGMLQERKRTEPKPPIVCSQSQWLYTDRGGLLEVLPELASKVEKGQPIAVLRNAFGDVIRQYESPRDGIAIGKSVNPVGPTGSRILHLGREMESDHELHPTKAELAAPSGPSH